MSEAESNSDSLGKSSGERSFESLWECGGKAAALATGIAIGAARSVRVRRDCDGIRGGDWANGCGVHGFILLRLGRGVHTPPIRCMNLKTKGIENGQFVSA